MTKPSYHENRVTHVLNGPLVTSAHSAISPMSLLYCYTMCGSCRKGQEQVRFLCLGGTG
ncbi:hypothetical protein GJAV_G00128760 [Gymnothorax javanicus]|nr:hypothetical protein GJAV_G00128760 [Gymnothorax javanicus]